VWVAYLTTVEGLTLEVIRPKYIYSLLYSLDCTRSEKLAKPGWRSRDLNFASVRGLHSRPPILFTRLCFLALFTDWIKQQSSTMPKNMTPNWPAYLCSQLTARRRADLTHLIQRAIFSA
jgi:hypothetical protein